MPIGLDRRPGTALWWEVRLDSMFSQYGYDGIPYPIVEIIGGAAMEVCDRGTSRLPCVRNQFRVTITKMVLG